MEKNIEEIINVSDYLYNNKLVAGKAGNVSARFKGEDGDVIAITPTLKSLYGLNELIKIRSRGISQNMEQMNTIMERTLILLAFFIMPLPPYSWSL